MFEFQNKEKGIFMRVTEAEKDYIALAAKKDKLTISNFIRKAIKFYIENHLDKEVDKEIKKAIDREDYNTL